MRRTTSTSYITPYHSDGTLQTLSTAELGPGTFTLDANTTYYFPIGGQDAPVLSVQLQHDAAIAITSAKIEDTNFPDSDVDHYSGTAGEWIDEDPTTAFVGVVGAGTSQTNGVVAVVAGNQGGALWHVADTGARRSRLAVAVGATGGEVRVATWGKD